MFRAFGIEKGATALEYAISLPLVFFMFFASVDLGIFYFRRALLQESADTALRATAVDVGAGTTCGTIPAIAANNAKTRATVFGFQMATTTASATVTSHAAGCQLELQMSAPVTCLICQLIPVIDSMSVTSSMNIEDICFVCDC